MPRKIRSVTPANGNKKVVSAAQFLLDALFGLTELLIIPGESRYEYICRLEGRPKELPRHRIYQEMKRMKQRGWIIEAEKRGKKFIALSEKGQLEVLYRRITESAVSKKSRWDGKWRLAIFDIPERGRHERDAIRFTLRSVGFQQLQKSVYIYPFEIPIDVIEYLKAAKLVEFIQFARVDKIDDDRRIQKMFKLKRGR